MSACWRIGSLLVALPLLTAADEPGAERAAPQPAARAPARSAPATAPKPAATTTASTAHPTAHPSPTSAPSLRLYRFDALRVEGLAGPNALVLHRLQRTRRRSLLRKKRSFLYRVLEAVEVGANGRP